MRARTERAVVMKHNTTSCLLVLLSLLALSAACFKHPADKVDQMVCSSDNQCPTGYHCITNLEHPGRCLKSGATDGGPSSPDAGNTGTAGSGGAPVTGGSAGGVTASTDSPATGGMATAGVGGTTSTIETTGGAGASGGTTARAGTITGGSMITGGTTATNVTSAGGGTTGAAGNAGGASAASAGGGTTSAGGNAGGASATGGAPPSGGSTAARVCARGEHLCKDGSTLLTCDDSGQWPSEGSDCDFVCRGNQCAGECTPMQIGCSGNSMRQCDSDGNWPISYKACGSGYTCDTARGGCFCPHALCENDVCIDTKSDPENCGSCNTRCPGACSAGACQCTTKSASNLIKDGGFDGDLSAWSFTARPDSAVIRAPLDATNCSSSGSLHYTFTSVVATGSVAIVGPCFPIDASLKYNMGAWIYIPKAAGSTSFATFGVFYFSDADCQTPNSVNDISGTWKGTMGTGFDQWQNLRVESTVPFPGTRSARFTVEVGSNTAGGMGQAYFDNLYFTPTPGHF